MTDLSLINIVLVALLVLGGLIFTIIGLKFFDTTEVTKRIQTFIVDEQETGLPASLSTTQRQTFAENLFQRTVLSGLNTLMTFMGRFTPQQSLQEMNRQLVVAGNPFNLRAQQFYGLRLLLALGGLLIGFLFYQIDTKSFLNLAMGMLICLVFIMFPNVWIRTLIRRRQDMIRRNLPDALDMLSVCAAAGLSFDQSLLRVGQTFKTAIGLEFARVVAEMEIGVSRQQALRNMQARVDLADLSSFVAMIVQSEALGMSISDVLRSQAEQMRINRQHRAKEAAQSLPAKMMVPLVFFIFPALLAVLLGPSVPELMNLLK